MRIYDVSKIHIKAVLLPNAKTKDIYTLVFLFT